MTVATDQRVHLPELLQSLIDSRLDTIDRMLLGRVGRAERMSIVREVESQIQELLGERDTDDFSREDVLAVLGRLDPPEAFLPEEFESHAPTAVRGPSGQVARSSRQGHDGAARASGLLGLAALSCLLVIILSYSAAMIFVSVVPFYVGAAISIPCMFICSVLGIALGIYARRSGVWALVGVVTGSLALVLSLMTGVFVVLYG